MSPKLFSLAMNEISDRYIDEALTYQASTERHRAKPLLRMVLAACLAIIMGIGTAFAVSAEFREAVFGWFKEQYETFTHYEYRDEEGNDDSDVEISTLFVPHRLTEVPPGYIEIDSDFDEEVGQQLIIYRNEEEGKTCFVSAGSGGHVFLEAEGYTIQPVEVAGVTGEIYLPDDPTKDSCIIWMKENMFFYISGYFMPEELVYYAECLQPVPVQEEETKDYRLGYIPTGYTYYGNSDTPSHKAAIYVNEEGQGLSLYCITDPEGSAMTIIHNDHTHAVATVHGVEADLQISNSPDEDNSSITWEEDGVLFHITAFLPKDELIALAESVEEVLSSEMEDTK